MSRVKTLTSRVPTIGNRLTTMQSGSWRTSTMTASQRGYGSKWQKARAGYLVSHLFCVYCLRDLGIDFTTIEGVFLECVHRDVAVPYGNIVDHRIPHRGDMKLFWDKSNWQTMCTDHHSAEKQRSEAIDA